jgi:Selenocysteine-specific translation elongation factor
MGDRAAINLSAPELGDLYREKVIADIDSVKTTQRLIANVSIINDTKWKLKNNQRVHIHIGTAQVIAKALISEKSIAKSQSTNVLFILDKPVAAIMDQRFIIRSFSPMETIGGCIVLDPNPMQTKRLLKQWTNQLELKPSKRFKQFISYNWKNPKSLLKWSYHFNTNKTQIGEWILKEDIENKHDLLFTKEKYKSSIDTVKEFLKQFHLDNPYQESLSKEELKKKTHFSEKWLSFILDSISDIVIKTKGSFALKTHSVVLSDKDSKLSSRLEKSLIDSGYELPSADTLFSDEPQKALELLHVLKKNE